LLPHALAWCVFIIQSGSEREGYPEVGIPLSKPQRFES
jgi:hypothetical protein